MNRIPTVLLRKPKYTPVWEFVTPGRAKELLRGNINNRVLTKVRVKEFATIIATGNYLPSHQGVCVDINGLLVDGQHRMEAIIMSGIGCWMLVTYNAPTELREVVDNGKIRTNLAISLITGRIGDSNQIFAIAKKLELGVISSSQASMNSRILFPLVDKYDEGLNFIKDIGGAGLNSNVSTPIVRCYYEDKRNREKLARFVEILNGGNSEGLGESAAIKLREFLMVARRKPYDTGKNRNNLNEIIYYTTEAAIINFLHGKNVKRLVAVSSEMFKLPNNLNGYN
jgi:hypothetical protein